MSALWPRDELLVILRLDPQISSAKLYVQNPEMIHSAKLPGRDFALIVQKAKDFFVLNLDLETLSFAEIGAEERYL